jgi:uncharacterized protein
MIIDFHGHVGSIDCVGARQSASELIRAMDRAGIEIACLFNICHGNASLGNNLTAQFVAEYPERFIGFAFVTPYYPEEIEKELARGIDQLGMKGIKIYPPFYSRSIEGPIWEPVFAFAHARGLPVISHTDGTDALVDPNHSEPQMFVPWAQRYPDAKIVLAHAGNFRTGRESCIEAARRSPNIFVEICSSWRHFSSIEELVAGAGEDRILFGSDLLLMDPCIQMGRVVTANVSQQAKCKILGENASKPLGLDGKSGP